MQRFLILYQSKNGQTEKIANHISYRIQKLGHSVTIFNINQPGKPNMLKHYDGVIVGAPVYAGRFANEVTNVLKKESADLNRLPSAFFSVCLGILQNDEKVKTEEFLIVQNLFEKTKWHPKTWSIFAGSLHYLKYNWFIRLIMKRIAKKAGGSTDTSTNHEYTDWNQVNDFTDKFIQTVNESNDKK